MTDRLDPGAAITDLERVGAEDFAELIAEASSDQLAEIVNGSNRREVLDEIFGRMAAHLEPERARGTEAVVHFKILDFPESLGGGYDHYEVVFDDGRCTASDRLEGDVMLASRLTGFFRIPSAG